MMLRVLMVEGEDPKPKSFLQYFVVDQELHRNREQLKLLYQQNSKDATCAFKLALCYLQMNRLTQSVELIASACKHQPTNQVFLFWKGVIYFYYIWSKR